MQCDGDGNLYAIPLPRITDQGRPGVGRTGGDQPPGPRKALRISADGKERTTFDPSGCPDLAKAEEVQAVRTTLGPDGALHLLVWVTWARGGDAQTYKGGQYILSFDKKGECRSKVEIAHEKLRVRRFEVFGSGDYLLVGHPADLQQVRFAILEAGGALREVTGWSGFPSGLAGDMEEEETIPSSDYMVGGDDGRIYVAEQDARLAYIPVFAFEPSGVSGEAFRLRSVPKRWQLRGLQAVTGKVAAHYFEASPDGKGGRWWISVVDSSLGEVQALYGPASSKPLCYQREGSEDRFTFFSAGKLVTMAP
jgi:hypothetical protein